MATKAAYQKKLEADLKDWEAQFNLWSAKAGKATAMARISYEDELESLKRKRDTAIKTLERLGKRSDDTWEDMKVGVEHIWEDMNRSIERAASRFK